MASRQGIYSLPGPLRSFIASIGLLALLGPSLGPLIDHHFAERHHNHVHLYLGSYLPDHTHSYDFPHNHHPSDVAVFPNPTDQPVFLTSTDAAAPVVVSLGAVPIAVDITFLADGDAESLLAFFDEDNPLVENFVPPPKRPPRA